MFKSKDAVSRSKPSSEFGNKKQYNAFCCDVIRTNAGLILLGSPGDGCHSSTNKTIIVGMSVCLSIRYSFCTVECDDRLKIFIKFGAGEFYKLCCRCPISNNTGQSQRTPYMKLFTLLCEHFGLNSQVPLQTFIAANRITTILDTIKTRLCLIFFPLKSLSSVPDNQRTGMKRARTVLLCANFLTSLLFQSDFFSIAQRSELCSSLPVAR